MVKNKLTKVICLREILEFKTGEFYEGFTGDYINYTIIYNRIKPRTFGFYGYHFHFTTQSEYINKIIKEILID